MLRTHGFWQAQKQINQTLSRVKHFKGDWTRRVKGKKNTKNEFTNSSKDWQPNSFNLDPFYLNKSVVPISKQGFLSRRSKSKFPLHNLYSYYCELIGFYWRNTTVQISLHAKSVGYKFNKTFVLMPCPTNGNPHIQFYKTIPIGSLVITVKGEGDDYNHNYRTVAISPLCLQQTYYVNECYMLHRCLLPPDHIICGPQVAPVPYIRESANCNKMYGVGCRPTAESPYQISQK
jgi:hypothetical protein